MIQIFLKNKISFGDTSLSRYTHTQMGAHHITYKLYTYRYREF